MVGSKSKRAIAFFKTTELSNITPLFLTFFAMAVIVYPPSPEAHNPPSPEAHYRNVCMYANPVILGGLFANGKGLGGYLPMLNR